MEELSEEHKGKKMCYIDAFTIASKAEFYKAFARNVIACASSKIERCIDDAKKFLSEAVSQIVVNNQTNEFIAFDMKYVPREQDKLTILRLPEASSRSKGIKIIVCIDEFLQLATLPEHKDIEGKMRSA